MIPDLYLNKAHTEEDPASDTVFSSLETPYSLDYNFDSMFDEESKLKLRELPEFQNLRCLLFPDDAAKQLWDTVVIGLMVYTVLITPYRIAFIEVDDFPWLLTDLLVDFLFGVDIALNFFTPYYDQSDNLVTEKRRIAVNYLCTWFLMDVTSCFPFQLLFDQWAHSGSILRIGRLPRLYRIIKFSKIARLIRFYRNRGKCISLLSCCSRISVGLERVSYLCLMSLVVIHVIACMWYFVARYDYPTVDSWVVEYNQIDSSNWEIYVSACYWTITTISTVGYGDVIPCSSLERVYCSCIMIVGIVFYSYTIGTVTGVLTDFDRRQTKLHAKLSALQDICKKYRLSPKFFKQLKTALEQDQYHIRKEREGLLNSLPKKLSAKLTFVMHKLLLANNRFFKRRSMKFLQSLLPLLRPLKLSAEEVVYHAYEVCDEMYFVGRGTLGYFIDELHVHIIYEEIRNKDYFGEVEFFYAEQRETSVKTTTACELLALVREDLFNKLFPEFKNLKIEMIIEAAATRERLKNLREEIEQKRREQYKRAKGLPLTLSSNEIERLTEMQPSLRHELLFEDEYVRVPASALPVIPQEDSSPVEPAHKMLSMPARESEQRVSRALPIDTAKEPFKRKQRRSLTSPPVHIKEETDNEDFRQTRISELKTIMNSHTLALLEDTPNKHEPDQALRAFSRIEARLERIEQILAGLIEEKRRERRATFADSARVTLA